MRVPLRVAFVLSLFLLLLSLLLLLSFLFAAVVGAAAVALLAAVTLIDAAAAATSAAAAAGFYAATAAILSVVAAATGTTPFVASAINNAVPSSSVRFVVCGLHVESVCLLLSKLYHISLMPAPCMEHGGRRDGHTPEAAPTAAPRYHP